MFSGSITALITPFKDDKIDYAAFEKIMQWQIEKGTHGFVPVGTTGESCTLSEKERAEIIKLSVEMAGPTHFVIAGTGSNNTAQTIALTQQAEKIGCSGALIVTPYYNKPTQEGVYEHFYHIHQSTSLPLILYDVPGRTTISFSDDLLIELSALPRIKGIKDASAQLARPILLKEKMPKEFCWLSGDDPTVLPFLAAGGQGCISVTANIAPSLCVELYKAFEKKDIQKAQFYQSQLAELNQLLFTEPNPIPIKFAMSFLGLCENTLRLPLTKARLKTQEKIRACLDKMEILS